MLYKSHIALRIPLFIEVPDATPDAEVSSREPLRQFAQAGVARTPSKLAIRDRGSQSFAQCDSYRDA